MSDGESAGHSPHPHLPCPPPNSSVLSLPLASYHLSVLFLPLTPSCHPLRLRLLWRPGSLVCPPFNSPPCLTFTPTELKEGKPFSPHSPGCQSFLPACRLTFLPSSPAHLSIFAISIPSSSLRQIRTLFSVAALHRSFGSPPLPTNPTSLAVLDDFVLPIVAVLHLRLRLRSTPSHLRVFRSHS